MRMLKLAQVLISVNKHEINFISIARNCESTSSVSKDFLCTKADLILHGYI